MGTNKNLMMALIATSSLLTACLQSTGSSSGGSSAGSTNNGQNTGGGTGTLPPPDFQVPPPIVLPPPPPPPVMGLEFEGGIRATNQLDVRAHMIGFAQFFEMKLAWNNDCTGESWENTTEYKSVRIPSTNSKHALSLQYKDSEFGESICFTATIAHDDRAPEILIQKYPAAVVEEGVAPELIYTISDLTHVDASCSLNGKARACASGGPNTVKFTSLPEGNYSYVMSATDEVGNSSAITIAWQVVSTTKPVTQWFNMNNYRQVDVIMIIDNSGSMQYEQQSMAQRTGNLLSVLRGLDWQIGITTTDPTNLTWGDGRLLPIKGLTGKYILDSSMPEADAQSQLSQTLQRTETGSGSEQAIFATYRVLERSQDGANPDHSRLIRNGAHLAAVVISDEDESANGAKNDPNNLLSYINTTFGGQKNFSFHSIITRPGDTTCRSTYGAAYGERYNTFSTLTGGVIGSVCELDYAVQVQNIATGIRNLLKTMTLQCAPLAGYPITIKKDGAAFTESFVVEGVNLKFANELPPGQYETSFRCLK